jgi:hypothetical protein
MRLFKVKLMQILSLSAAVKKYQGCNGFVTVVLSYLEIRRLYCWLDGGVCRLTSSFIQRFHVVFAP